MRKTVFILALLLSVFTVKAAAQFEGKITYTFYETNDNGDRQDEDAFTAFITPQRILLQGEDAFDVGSLFMTDGLLIRLDKKDFVFFTDKNKAMSISKSGITSFINMFSDIHSKQNDTDEIEKDFTFTQTNETKTIGSYNATKFIFQSKEDDDKAAIWMTRDIDINWGMLAEPWGDSVAFLTQKNLPSGLILQEGWLPLQGTFYKDGETEGEFSAQVEPKDIKKEKVHLAPDVTVTSLSEYLFQHMRDQQ